MCIRDRARGDAGFVTVVNSGAILTKGDRANAISSSVIAGGGGYALTGFGDVSLGGVLGSGSSLGSLMTNTGAIETRGDQSAGVVQQVIGGGGGFVLEADGAVRLGSQDASADQSSGDLTYNSFGSVSTDGDFSTGILLQTIGGGGGAVIQSQGNASLGLGTGVSSLKAIAGSITLKSSGDTVLTRGKNSPALVLQSIGGGGGLITNASQAQLGTTNSSGSLSSGVILANMSTEISTLGSQSAGVIAQSLGGGGGWTNFVSGDLGLGATQSRGSLSGNGVTVNSSGAIATIGAGSAGVIAQSIGGGGGASTLVRSQGAGLLETLRLGAISSSNGSAGGSLSLSNTGRVTTSGDASPGLVAQSIGGGGGAIQALGRVSTRRLRLGSKTATNASAGSLMLSPIQGVIATSGARSAAAVIQSVGGGGGWALVDSDTASTLGSTDLKNGSGGAISLVLRGALQTTGTISPGLVIQSVGGGGGFAGNTSTDGVLGSSGGSGDLGISGSSGLIYPVACAFGSCAEAPVKQAVLVDIQGSVSTAGITSPVMLVQAIGGGGGRLGTIGGDATLGMASSSGNADGGSIRVISNAGASLSSSGVYSAALMVQSIGGGGGSVNNVGGDLQLGGSGVTESRGGSVTLNGPFQAVTTGQESPGVVLQSIGGGGGGDDDGDAWRIGC